MNGLLRRFVVPAIVALAIMVVLMSFSVWVVEQPPVARQLDRVASRMEAAAEADSTSPLPTMPERQEVPVVERRSPAPVDCRAESARINQRFLSARACATDLDCVISAPRHRCIVALRVGIAGAIEDDILTAAGRCPSALVLPTLDELCRAPDRGWVPHCADNVCALHDSFDPGP
ncbi:MAG: hypothetical protein AAGC71_01160 [Pseudomonadota bacterium]